MNNNSLYEQPNTPKPLTGVMKFVTIFVLSLALAIIILDTTLLNVSLSAIIKEFKTDVQSIQWVITAYSLTLAALTITGGRMGDLFGKKRMFMSGAIIFAVGSFIASISHNVPTMILGESIIEGVGAALMMPATSSILLSTFHGKDRAFAFGIWGGVAGAAAALGPILGGYLTTNYSWRWGFRINIFVAALLCLGALVIQDRADNRGKRAIDWLGVLLSSTGLLAFVFGLIEASRYGWFYAKEIFAVGTVLIDLPWNLSIVPLAMLIGLLLLDLFVIWELAVEEKGQVPLVSMKLFSNNQFRTGALTTAVLSLGQSGIIFSLPVFLQAVKGYDAFQTGLSLLPMSLTLLVISPLAALLSTKIRPKLLIMTGLLINLGAMLVLRQSFSVEATSWTLAPGLAMFGMGMGLVMSQISNLTLSAVPVQEAGEASGVNNTFRQIGSTMGSALIGAVLLSSLSTHLSSGVTGSTVISTPLKPKIISAVSNQTSNVEFGGGAKLTTVLPAPITTEITRISHEATVSANKDALFYGALFAFLGLVLSLTLPNVKHIERAPGASGGH